MRITILDFVNQDPGLKILFPAADYYVYKTEAFSLQDRMNLYKKYGNLEFRTDIENIRGGDDDVLFVVAALYNSCRTWNLKANTHFNQEIHDFFWITLDIIRANKFKKVYFFDNYDYDYDPNQIFIENRVYDFIREYNISFFKRFYARDKIYCDNVYSFPYIMFGRACNIDIIGGGSSVAASSPLQRLFFSGALAKHDDDVYGVHRDRRQHLQRIAEVMGNFLVYKNNLPYDTYINEMRNSAFCLDLPGVGEPNKRLFEILASGSLLIQSRTRLEWNFDEGDDFSEETYYDDHTDLLEKIKKLATDAELYGRCLAKQCEIVSKYMSFDALREYIVSIVAEEEEELPK